MNEEAEKTTTVEPEKIVAEPPPKVEPIQQPQELLTAQEWEKMQKEASEYRNKYLTLLAEMENLRKRLQKEQGEERKKITIDLIAAFLTPLDHMEKALGFASKMSDEVKNWAIGFEMILAQFKQVLDTYGVKPIESTGTRFNPHLHEAVEMVKHPSIPPGVIVEELTRGYMLDEKVVRAARVKVSEKNLSIKEET